MNRCRDHVASLKLVLQYFKLLPRDKKEGAVHRTVRNSPNALVSLAMPTPSHTLCEEAGAARLPYSGKYWREKFLAN